MTAAELIRRLQAPEADAVYADLYGPEAVAAARKRYRDLAEATLRDFPECAADLRVFTAPGRTELGGNHTDHNHGKVLAAAIQLDAVAFVAPRTDSTVVFRSVGYPDVRLDLADLAPRSEEAGTTEALVRGIAAEFTARGTRVRGFTANAASTVLPGSGLSSSAAVEVLFGTIFDRLYGQGTRTPTEIAQIGQKAENVYFGKPCGLMDQVACASGGAVAIDFADPAQPRVRQVDFDLAAAGYALCVVDTGGSHADLTADYAAIPAEMKAVAAGFGRTVLRDVGRDELIARAAELRSRTGDRALLRALHFMAENRRVDALLAALERAGNPAFRDDAVADFLCLVRESGASSWQWLQNVYAAPREQGLSLALALTAEFMDRLGPGPSQTPAAPGRCPGAWRVHGGGFAGTIQAYIPRPAVADYIAWMTPVFGPRAVTALRIRRLGAVELTF